MKNKILKASEARDRVINAEKILLHKLLTAVNYKIIVSAEAGNRSMIMPVIKEIYHLDYLRCPMTAQGIVNDAIIILRERGYDIRQQGIFGDARQPDLKINWENSP